MVWELFALVTLFMLHKGQLNCIPLDLARYHSLILIRLRIAASASNDGESSKRPGILEVLPSFRWCRATRPVDGVYGILGLIEGTEMVPDYTVDVETCYTATAREILSQIQALDILDFVAPPVPLKQIWQCPMPSWAPNWSMYDRAGPHGEALQTLKAFSGERIGVGKGISYLRWGRLDFKEMCGLAGN